jgi:hypothetical protein
VLVYFEELNLLEYLLHGSTLVPSELQDLSHGTLIDYFSHDLLPFSQFNDLFVTLLVEEGNDVFE